MAVFNGWSDFLVVDVCMCVCMFVCECVCVCVCVCVCKVLFGSFQGTGAFYFKTEIEKASKHKTADQNNRA